jgi:GAF domain-containing protein
VLADPGIQRIPELRRFAETTDNRAVLAVPLKVRGQVVAVVTVTYPAGRVLREHDRHRAEAFADRVALALENARLFTETRERLAASETLLAVAGVLSQSLPIEETMRRVAREVARSFGADMVGVYFLDARPQGARAHGGLPRAEASLVRVHRDALPRGLAPRGLHRALVVRPANPAGKIDSRRTVAG